MKTRIRQGVTPSARSLWGVKRRTRTDNPSRMEQVFIGRFIVVLLVSLVDLSRIAARW
jgi:hypothetical protein